MNQLPITIYGSTTCEDTAVVAARLRALQIPFALHYTQQDANVNLLLEKYNSGARVTPTLVLGNEQVVLSEPTLEELETRLRDAGYIFTPPRATEIRGELKNQRLPNFTLPSSAGGTVTLYKLGGHRRAVLFFVDDPADRTAQGYARQLTNARPLFDDYNGVPLPIVTADLPVTKAWADEFARGYAALSDPQGTVKQKYAALFGISPADALLVIADTYYAPRAISSAPDGGGLIAPGEVASWLRLFDCECDE
jgi:peroxiredoxin